MGFLRWIRCAVRGHVIGETLAAGLLVSIHRCGACGCGLMRHAHYPGAIKVSECRLADVVRDLRSMSTRGVRPG